MSRRSAATLIFDPRDLVPLTFAFGRLKSVVAPHGPKLIANIRTARYFDHCVHEGLLGLVLEAPDGTYSMPDAVERRKLHICVPLNYQEGCSIEPYHEGHWHALCSDLDKLTTIPRAEAELAPTRTPPAVPSQLPGAEQQPQPPPPPAAFNAAVPAPAPSVPSPPAEGSQPRAREADAAPVEPEGSPSATGQTVAKPAPETSAKLPGVSSPGGRPTDRDMVLEEAAWRLRQPGRTQAKTLAAFARELHKWLSDHGKHRGKKTGKVMKAGTIERHVRSLWKSRGKTV
jgi:hypothetical protein